MRIVGFSLTKILIERKEQSNNKIEIQQNIDIKNITKQDISITNEEVLKIDFGFIVNYSEDFAKVEFDGNLIVLPTKEELKQVLDDWKKKKIPDHLRVFLFNFIMNKCNIKALNLEDELNLPLHIPMPKVAPPEVQKQTKEKLDSKDKKNN